MKVFIDTNILFSAALFPDGTTAKALYEAVSYPNRGMVTDYVIDELRRIVNRKAPQKIGVLEQFLSYALLVLDIIPTPEESVTDEMKVRDEKDRPILRAAMAEHVDVILTGDRDLLESGITNPKILSAAEFLKRSF